MLTIEDAFAKFNHRQELTRGEQDDASRRHLEVRDHLKTEVKLQRDFLTGSYARWTKTRPLKDVDVFCVLHADEEGYRRKHPSEILTRFKQVLAKKYGDERVCVDRMAVVVNFGVQVDAEDDTGDKVMSIEAVPAFAKGDHFEIPDEVDGRWIETNPEIHADMAVTAHQRMQAEWKPMVRMIKKWNRTAGSPIEPSFLIEVMALEILQPPFSGGYPYELKAFFATAAQRMHEAWPDPAGLGSYVNTMSAQQRNAARQQLIDAEKAVSNAQHLARTNRTGDALKAWRTLFGPHFPLS
ncbi:MAG: CBASS oligonucleotide cyclase [Dehalococcoidia bacterium]